MHSPTFAHIIITVIDVFRYSLSQSAVRVVGGLILFDIQSNGMMMMGKRSKEYKEVIKRKREHTHRKKH